MKSSSRTTARVLGSIALVMVVGAASFGVARAVASDGTEPADEVAEAPAGSGALVADAVETESVPVLSPVALGVAEDLDLLGFEGTGPDAAAPIAPDASTALSRSVGRAEVPPATSTAADTGGIPVMDERTGGPVGPDPVVLAAGELGADPAGSDDDADEGGAGGGADGSESPDSPPGSPRATPDPVELLGDPGDEIGAPTFVDVCAGEEPGAGLGDETCPGDGEGATIIGTFAIESTPPLWVTGYAYPVAEGPEVGFVAQCPPMDHGDDEVPFGITSSNPATITFTWWTDRDPSVQRQELVTSDADRAEWDAWVDGGATEHRVPYVMPRHCTTIPAPEVGDTVYFSIIAVDDAGQVASAADVLVQTHFTYRGPRVPSAPRWRPPTRLIAPRANEVAVVAPVKPGQAVQVFAYARNNIEGADPCTTLSMSDHPGYDPPTRTWLPNTSEISLEARSSDTYAWDRSYDRTQWGGIRLPAGRNVRLCVVRHREDGPTYTWGPEDVEAIEVSTPDLRRFRMRLVDVSSREAVARGALTIVARPANRPIFAGESCWGRFANEGLERGANPHDHVLCGPRATALDLFTRGVVLDLTFTEPGAEPVTETVLVPLDLACDGRCDPPEEETFRLELPTVSRPAGLCSPGLFESTCEPPRSDTVLGSATLQIEYLDGGGNGLDRWWVGPAEELGDPRPEPDGPQLDLASPGSPFGPVEAPGWRQRLDLDRPATVEVSLEAPSPDEELCTTSDGAVTAVVVPEAATSHSVEFTGLCPGTFYVMALRLTDADGDTTAWSVPRTEGATPWLGALVRTESLRLGVGSTIEIGPFPGAGDGAFVHRADASVNSQNIMWVNELTGCRPDWRRINGNPTTVSSGENVRLWAVVHASGVRGPFGCSSTLADGSPAWEGGAVRLEATIPWSEAVGADEIVLRSGPDDPFPVTATFRITRSR